MVYKRSMTSSHESDNSPQNSDSSVSWPSGCSGNYEWIWDSTRRAHRLPRVRCVIKGRVQGVFYRNWTVENASQLGLTGWVRNRRDGSVEALFCGKPESVDEMQQRCRRGPQNAMVTSFQDFPCDDNPGTGFERKPTV